MTTRNTSAALRARLDGLEEHRARPLHPTRSTDAELLAFLGLPLDATDEQIRIAGNLPPTGGEHGNA